MPAIGHVTKQSTGGFKGQIKTLSIRADIDIVPNTSKSADQQPDFRVLSQGVEIGGPGYARAKFRGINMSRSASPHRNLVPASSTPTSAAPPARMSARIWSCGPTRGRTEGGTLCRS